MNYNKLKVYLDLFSLYIYDNIKEIQNPQEAMFRVWHKLCLNNYKISMSREMFSIESFGQDKEFGLYKRHWKTEDIIDNMIKITAETILQLYSSSEKLRENKIFIQIKNKWMAL